MNISPQIRALEEIGNASGKSALGLGGLATAGLALGVGMAAWGITRSAMEFLNLDGAVQKAWERVLGFEAGVAEAGAKSDVLARASKTAGREITDMAEAMRINRAAADAQSLAWGRSKDAAHDTMVAVSGWQREIRAVRANGDIPQLTLDLDSQNFSLKDLSVKYGVSVGALGYFTKAQKDTAAELKTTTAAHEAQAKSVREYYNWVGERAIAHEQAIQTALKGEAAAYRAFNNEIGVLRMEQDARDLAHTAAAAAAIAGEGQALMEAAAAEHTARVAAAGLNAEVAKTGPIAVAASASINDLANAMNASAGVIVGSARAIEQAYNAAGIGQNNYFLSGTPGRPTQTSAALRSYDTGGPVLQDGPIYAHAGEYVVPKGGGGGGIVIHVHGNLLTSKAELARLIKDALANAHMAGGGRMPA